MSTIMTLEEAVRCGIIKIGDYLDYTPVSGKCTVTPEQTGWHCEQTFATQQDFGWRLEKPDEDFLLVADDATDAELILRGRCGFKHGIEAMNYICEKLYSNPWLCCKATAITEEIWRKVYRTISNKPYWLGSSCVYTYANYAGFGLRRVDSGRVGNYGLYYSNGSTYRNHYGVRPVVSLKSDIRMEILEGCDGSKERPWHIVNSPLIPYQDGLKANPKQLLKEGEELQKKEQQLRKEKKELREKRQQLRKEEEELLKKEEQFLKEKGEWLANVENALSDME